MMTEEYAWLTGRELLMTEVDRRIQAVRNTMSRDQPVLAFRAGLMIYLERRLDRLREMLLALRQSVHPISDGRRQTVDRMVSAVVETLRNAEIPPCQGAGRNEAHTLDRRVRIPLLM